MRILYNELSWKYYLLLFVATLIYFLPVITNPSLFFDRGNDMQEFFWPIYYYARDQILNHGTFPLWNNLFLSGTPLLPDPQSPLFYPPNIIFLLLPINVAFMISSVLHVYAGGVFTFITARRGFEFTKYASLFVALAYITSPKLAGFIEAGHFGLIESLAWLPLVLLSSIKLAKSPKFEWWLVLSISMAGLFFTHTVTFFLAGLSSLVIFLSMLRFGKDKKFLYTLVLYFLSVLVAFGLTAIALLPQITWQEITNRSLLLAKPQVFPVWTSKLEFIKALFVPWAQDGGLHAANTETFFPVGVVIGALAFVGFLKIRWKFKILVFGFGSVAGLIALSNASPAYNFLLRQEWYVLMRIPTRVWFVFFFMAIYLAGHIVSRLDRKGTHRRYLNVILVLLIVEFVAMSWVFMTKPFTLRNTVPSEVHEFIKKDPDQFRVLCLSRCIWQRDAVVNGFELAEGYSTLTQLNYYRASLGITGGYWDYYALPTPPTGVYKFQDLQPTATVTGEYNIKYIISDHELTDSQLRLEDKFGIYYVYLNPIYKPRASGPILSYSPNLIRVDTSKLNTKSVILSEVYSPGWNAYLDGVRKVPVQETPVSLRAVDITENTQFVDFEYAPNSYKIGRRITSVTVLFLAGWVILRWRGNA